MQMPFIFNFYNQHGLKKRHYLLEHSIDYLHRVQLWNDFLSLQGAQLLVIPDTGGDTLQLKSPFDTEVIINVSLMFSITLWQDYLLIFVWCHSELGKGGDYLKAKQIALSLLCFYGRNRNANQI